MQVPTAQVMNQVIMSGQDGPILPVRDYEESLYFMPCKKKTFIDQNGSVKMAGY